MRLLWLVVALLSSAGARAQSRGEDISAAKAHFTAATSDFDRGEFADAEREFLVALKLSGRVDLYYNIARCQEQLGKLDDAITSVNRYLAARPDDSQGLRLLGRLEKAKIDKGNVPPPETSSSVVTVTKAAPAEKPITKKPWFWGVIGASSAVVVAAVVLGAVLGTRSSSNPTLPTLRF
jgi:tetratricopeptide (TPR) repeat protein